MAKIVNTLQSIISKTRWYFDRTFSEKSSSQIAWLVGIIIAVYGLIWIFSYPFSERLFEDSIPSMSRPIRIISLLINPGAVSEVNPTMRIFAILVALIGIIVLSGFLITVLSNMLERHVEHYRNGDIHYKLKNHIIIIGFNEHAVSLIKKLLLEVKNEDRLLLVSGVPSSTIREQIEAEFSRNIWKRLVYYSEDISSFDSISKLDSDKANSIYIIGDNDGNDNVNIKSLEHLLKINEKRMAPVIPCYLFMKSRATIFIIKQKGFTKEWGKILRVIPVNIAENWAKKVLIFGLVNDWSPVRLIGSKGHNRLIIVGMTNWGIAMAEVFARVSHFSKTPWAVPKEYHSQEEKGIGFSTITFIDDDIETLKDKFCAEYSSFFGVQGYEYIEADNKGNQFMPHNGLSFQKVVGKGGGFLDVNFEFLKGNIYNSHVRQFLREAALDETCIAICGNNESFNVEIAIQLPDEIYKERIPIYVRQTYSNIIDDIVNATDYSNPIFEERDIKYSNIFPFGMIDSNNILFDNDDDFVQLITGVHSTGYSSETGEISSKLITPNNAVGNTPINKYIEQLYFGYYVHMLWSQLKEECSLEQISIILNDYIDEFMEIEHNRWCVNKLMSGISSTSNKDNSFYANDYIVAYSYLEDEFKQYLADLITYLQYLRNKEISDNGQH